jgi:hypothetical protein
MCALRSSARLPHKQTPTSLAQAHALLLGILDGIHEIGARELDSGNCRTTAMTLRGRRHGGSFGAAAAVLVSYGATSAGPGRPHRSG